MQIPISTIRYCAQRLQSSSNETDRFSALDVLNWLDWMGDNFKQAQKSAREPVTPRAGQVWQKLNVGTKTASKAPRITVLDRALDMVSVKNTVGQIRRMRTETLQRDWHCLNPES